MQGATAIGYRMTPIVTSPPPTCRGQRTDSGTGNKRQETRDADASQVLGMFFLVLFFLLLIINYYTLVQDHDNACTPPQARDDNNNNKGWDREDKGTGQGYVF